MLIIFLLYICCIFQVESYPLRSFLGKHRDSVKDSSCPAPENVITIPDVQHAFAASKFAYHDGTVNIGDKVPNTEFKVTFVHHDYMGSSDKIGIRVLIAESASETIVAYRGTDGNKQLLTQAIGMIKNFDGKEERILGKEVNINEFFLNAFKLSFFALRHRLIDPSRRYILTGHSLGGALASILAIKMAEYENSKMWRNPRSCLITFGEPRVGDKDFAILHDEYIQSYKKLRFVHRKDPVPHIPLWPWFKHHSREVLLDYDTVEKSWWEIWKDGKKQKYWRVCSKLEELDCSNYYSLTPSVDDHDLDEYKTYIFPPPDVFKNRFGKTVASFRKAILDSCNG